MGSNRTDFIKGADRNTIVFSVPFTGFGFALTGRSWPFFLQKLLHSRREVLVGLCEEGQRVFFVSSLRIAALSFLSQRVDFQLNGVVFNAIGNSVFLKQSENRAQFIRDKFHLEGYTMHSSVHLLNSLILRFLSLCSADQSQYKGLAKWRNSAPSLQYLYARIQ